MNKQTIVLADSSYTIRRIVELSFSDEDLTLISFENGINLREKLLEIKPVVILSDIKLPDFNGYDLCQYVSSKPELAHTKVFLMKGGFEPVDENRLKDLQYEDIITKPFDSNALVASIKKVLTGSPATPSAQPKAVADFPDSVPEELPEINESDDSEDDISFSDIKNEIESAEYIKEEVMPSEEITQGTIMERDSLATSTQEDDFDNPFGDELPPQKNIAKPSATPLDIDIEEIAVKDHIAVQEAELDIGSLTMEAMSIENQIKDQKKSAAPVPDIDTDDFFAPGPLDDFKNAEPAPAGMDLDLDIEPVTVKSKESAGSFMDFSQNSQKSSGLLPESDLPGEDSYDELSGELELADTENSPSATDNIPDIQPQIQSLEEILQEQQTEFNTIKADADEQSAESVSDDQFDAMESDSEPVTKESSDSHNITDDFTDAFTDSSEFEELIQSPAEPASEDESSMAPNETDSFEDNPKPIDIIPDHLKATEDSLEPESIAEIEDSIFGLSAEAEDELPEEDSPASVMPPPIPTIEYSSEPLLNKPTLESTEDKNEISDEGDTAWPTPTESAPPKTPFIDGAAKDEAGMVDTLVEEPAKVKPEDLAFQPVSSVTKSAATTFPATEGLSQEILSRLEDKLTIAVKEILWEVIPPLAEQIIQKELAELKATIDKKIDD
jgi:DNA-binding response OmpR family regulator